MMQQILPANRAFPAKSQFRNNGNGLFIPEKPFDPSKSVFEGETLQVSDLSIPIFDGKPQYRSHLTSIYEVNSKSESMMNNSPTTISHLHSPKAPKRNKPKKTVVFADELEHVRIIPNKQWIHANSIIDDIIDNVVDSSWVFTEEESLPQQKLKKSNTLQSVMEFFSW